MIRNHLKIAFRNLLKYRIHSAINMIGLSVGMAVAILIGLWIWDELSFDKNFSNYDRLAVVMQNQTFNGVTNSQVSVPYLMGEELRRTNGSDFKYISMSSWTNDHILGFGNKKITQSGNYMEPAITEMLSLNMKKGSRSALQNDHSLILSQSAATALFGQADPMEKLVTIDNKFVVKVSGVYEDIPFSSSFSRTNFIAPWKLYIDDNNWAEKATNPWRNNSFETLVQLADQADLKKVSEKIKNVKLHRVTSADAAFKPVVFLHPMRLWHLHSEFKNGVLVGGRMEYVWMFGVIGFFVLLLACINFMNLTTAKSEKRAKEVGIRKAVGSRRNQLIAQFFSESILVVVLSLFISLLLVELALPFFNAVADKKLALLWSSSFFWTAVLLFCVFTGLIAGSYPALYLSSFQPVKALKGSFKVGRLASLPRKLLVIIQFSISVALMIATVVVFRQIQYAKNRPVGYSREGMIDIHLVTEDVHKHFEVIRQALIGSGAILDMAETSSGPTYLNEVDNGFDWEGKDPSLQGDFGALFISQEFGRTMGWQIKEGRDFSKAFGTDSAGMILNEASVQFMGIKNPVGKTINWDGKKYHVIGVVKDMLMESPYDPVFRSVFVMDGNPQPLVVLRINPESGLSSALTKIEAVFKQYNPSQPFDYRFVDEEFKQKFNEEVRIGELAGFFAILAIFISCLGLFGMSSFMAEQRTKELGIRKVLGASVFSLWSLLSMDFVLLVIISLFIASPLAYFYMQQWLQRYEYRTKIPWWLFAAAFAGSLFIAMLTVSFQSIKAALNNPVRNLRSE